MTTERSRVRRNRVISLSVALAIGAAAAVVAPSTASADELSASGDQLSSEDVSESLDAVESLDSELIADPVTPDDGTAIEIQAPADPVDGVVLEDPEASISIGLPFASGAGDAEARSDGTVVYPDEGSANVVVPTYMGVQLLTVVADANSPTRYSYEIGLEDGQRLDVVADGVEVVDADGARELLVTTPWARDANGRDVATHFEVEGNSLTQVVSHTGDEQIAYPVVADPFLIGYFVRRCLMGIGLNGPQIARIAERGTLSAALAAGGWAAVRCIMGR